MGAYEVTARNFSEASENRIHSDEIAKKFGFRGALVPGVAVYGHATYPLVEAFGEDWLGHSASAVRLLKPTYHGDALTVAGINGTSNLTGTSASGADVSIDPNGDLQYDPSVSAVLQA